MQKDITSQKASPLMPALAQFSKSLHLKNIINHQKINKENKLKEILILEQLERGQEVNQHRQINELGSIAQYLNKDINHFSKEKSKHNHKRFKTIIFQSLKKSPENILLNHQCKSQDRIKACKIIAENSFRKFYDAETQKKLINNKGQNSSMSYHMMDMKVLQDIMNEMQNNPKSHSVMILKHDLQNRMRELSDATLSFEKDKVRKRGPLDEFHRIQVLYNLKNLYIAFVSCIIPSKNEQYQQVMSQYINLHHLQGTDSLGQSQFRQTLHMTQYCASTIRKNSRHTQMNEDLLKYEKFNKLKRITMNKHASSKFIISDTQLTLYYVTNVSKSCFLFMLSKSRFDYLKEIRLKSLNFSDEYILLLMDCIINMSSQGKVLKLLQMASIQIQNISRFSKKIKDLLLQIPIKVLKLQSMNLTTNEVIHLQEGISENAILQEISLKHNRINILGIRYLESICKKSTRLKGLDIRNNDIPHYANFKDKHPIITFL